MAKLSDEIELDTDAILISQQPIPGRPNKPELVAPRLLKHRSMVTPEGRATLIHAMAHIEFNAINLALDALWRFPNMPRAYYTDWLQVAGEEALHFSLLAEHLQNLGYQYGDFPAHNSLWEMADKTKHDVLARIALVPRTMEHADWMPPRKCAPSCCKQAMWLLRKLWTSSCVMKLVTSWLATVGMPIFASSAAWSLPPPIVSSPPNMPHLCCAGRLIWRHAKQRGLVRRSWRR